MSREQGRMRRWLKYGIVLGMLAGLVAGLRLLLPERPLEVKVFRVVRGPVRETVSTPSAGTVVSVHEAVVAAEAAGRVARFHFREGDRVAESSAVVTLEERDASVEVKAAEAAVARQRALVEEAVLRERKAQWDFDRVDSLYKRNLVPEDQFEAARVALEVARVAVETARRALAEGEVAVERARVALAKRRVLAPFTGVIRKRRVEVGEYVLPGTPCFEIYDDTNLFVRAPIDEVDVPRLEAGQTVEVTLESFRDSPIRGRVRLVDPGVRTAQDLNRTGEIEVDLLEVPAPNASAVPASSRSETQDGRAPPPAPPGVGFVAVQASDGCPSALGPLRVGMSADLEVIVRVKEGCLRIPAYAVHEDEQIGRFAFLVEAGRIARRTIRVGLQNWDYAEVLEGLAPGDAVVVSLDLEGLEAGRAARIAGEVTKVTAD